MIFTEYANDFWHKRKMYNFNPYNVLLAIATNILQRLKTGFVLQARVTNVKLGLGDMAKNIITIIIFISVDIDNYHDKCQIFIFFKFKARFLLQSESFTNQTINFP